MTVATSTALRAFWSEMRASGSKVYCGNWLADQSPRGDGKLVVDLPGPGRYILRAVDGNHGRSPAAYTIDTSLQ